MTVVEAPVTERSSVLRDTGLVVALFLVLLAVIVAVCHPRFDRWRHRHDIRVDFDPATTTVEYSAYRDFNPNRSRFVVGDGDRLLVATTSDRQVEAELDDVQEIAWVSPTVLVAFGQDTWGGFDGLAVVDLGDRTVRQVETHGHDDAAFRPIDAHREQVEVCQLVYDSNESREVCGDETWDLDVTTADLGEPMVMRPLSG